MPHDPESQVTLPWLVRLRWLAVLGQALAVAVAGWGFELDFSFGLLGALVLLAAASNLILAWVARGLPPEGSSPGWSATHIMGGVMTFDTLLLTALLAASGGPMNPFTVFYLVHITLSAVVLSARWTMLVAALSFAGFGVLFLLPIDGHVLQHDGSGLGPHLQGMWVAVVLAAGLTTFFVRRITQAIGRQHEQIAALREASAQSARLAAVTTLAAGAAHELGSPLGTIAVAAHDARLALAAIPEAGAVVDDLQLILLEVERCQDILGSMSSRAAPSADDPRAFSGDDLMRSVRDQLGSEQGSRVEFQLPEAALWLPPSQTTQSVVALVRNGLDASRASERVTVLVQQRGPDAHISVEDRGQGIPEAILGRVGEPFFTTKQPGRGLGLGIFLVRAFVESRGGELRIDSTPGVGTHARMRIPMDPARRTSPLAQGANS
ncbi:MAG TPA: HAMP domain-containing sensor histidine kinase [Polyangiaceae bacterium]|nr:HAMP domain-containing sensor histidine kinase [Polyangiaceae bacterium]